MRRVFTIGETVFDIFFRNDIPFEGKPGGAMLNTSVSLGRLNIPVHFISGISSDKIGNMINRFLNENQVLTNFVSRQPNTLSRLALAFLNEENNADYIFYKVPSAETVALQYPEPQPDDIILFGSFYGIKHEIRIPLVDYLKKAREKGAILIYDPNFRKNHIRLLSSVLPLIEENFQLAHIVKMSDEDLFNIYNEKDCEDFVNKRSDLYSKIFICTHGKKDTFLCYSDTVHRYQVPRIEPVSTVGAGDNFNAGLIYGLMKNNIFQNHLLTPKNLPLDSIVGWANLFGSHVCCSYENYVSVDFALRYKF